MSNSAAINSTSIQIKGTEYSILTATCFDGRAEISWDSLGEAMISNLADEVASVNGVDFRFGQESSIRRHGKPFSKGWEYVYEKHDVMVFRKESKNSPLSFMGRGVIDKPLREVAEFIKDMQNNLTWDNFIIEAKRLETILDTSSNTGYVGYQRFETTKCMITSKREMLYYAPCSYQGNRYYQGGISMENPLYPCPCGVKRIKVGLGSGWVMDKFNGSDTKTLVTYIGNIDLGGLPIFVMNLVLKRHPLAIHYVRTQMIDPRRTVPAKKGTGPVSSMDNGEEDSNSEDSIDGFISDSLDRSNDAVCSNSSTYYEQSVPIEYFIK